MNDNGKWNGKNAKKLRFLAKMTQREFGKEIGVDWTTVCAWENNRCQVPLKCFPLLDELAWRIKIEKKKVLWMSRKEAVTHIKVMKKLQRDYEDNLEIINNLREFFEDRVTTIP